MVPRKGVHMNEVRKKHKFIKNQEITTWETEVEDDNTLLAEAGTTGFVDAGATTFIKLSNKECTDMQVTVDNDGISLVFCGNSELLTLMKALNAIVHTLDDQICQAGVE